MRKTIESIMRALMIMLIVFCNVTSSSANGEPGDLLYYANHSGINEYDTQSGKNRLVLEKGKILSTDIEVVAAVDRHVLLSVRNMGEKKQRFLRISLGGSTESLRYEAPVANETALSPDKKKVASLTWEDAFSHEFILSVVELSTGRISRHRASLGQYGLSWTADSASVVTSDRSGTLLRIDTESGSVEKMFSGYLPSVSPDGMYLAYVRGSNMLATSDLVVRNMTTRREVVVDDHYRWTSLSWPARWSKKDSSVLYYVQPAFMRGVEAEKIIRYSLKTGKKEDLILTYTQVLGFDLGNW